MSSPLLCKKTDAVSPTASADRPRPILANLPAWGERKFSCPAL